MSKIHALKCRGDFFMSVYDNEKEFEVRKNDRDFKIGDYIVLCQRYGQDDGELSGLTCMRKIKYILTGGQFGVQQGYVVLGLEVVGPPF